MKKILFILLAIFSATISFSQTIETNSSSSAIVNQDNRTVEGTVVDESGEPLIGATVLVKGTTKGTVTDMDGRYSLSGVPANAIICCSYIGYISQERVAKTNWVVFVMKEEVQNLNTKN